MTKTQKISLAVLSVLLSVTAALSGFMVYTQLSDRQKEKEEFDTLAEMVEVTPEKSSVSSSGRRSSTWASISRRSDCAA